MLFQYQSIVLYIPLPQSFFFLVDDLDLSSFFPINTGNPFFNNAGYAIVGPNIELIPTTMTNIPTCIQCKNELVVVVVVTPTISNCFKCQNAPTASANAPTGKVTIGNTKRTYRAISDDGNRYIGYRPTSVSAQLYSTNVLISCFVVLSDDDEDDDNPAGNTISRHDMRITCNTMPNTKFPLS